MFKYRWFERDSNRVTLLIGQLGRDADIKIDRQRSREDAGDHDV